MMPQALPIDPFDRIAALVTRRTGFVVTDARRDDLVRAVRRLDTHSRDSDHVHFFQRLAADSALLDELLSEITITETYFFREPEHFDFLRREIVAPRPRDTAPFRAWSAGCASGEEAFTLAIVLHECGLGEHAHVLGTDISRSALTKAVRAIYGEWSFRGTDDAIVPRYFRQDGKHFLLDDTIRARVAFEYLNLAQDVYPALHHGTAHLDVIFCRNVLIYFDATVVAAVLRRLHASLAPHGWLVLGPSDPAANEHAPFEAVMTSQGIFYRRVEAATRPARTAPMEPVVRTRQVERVVEEPVSILVAPQEASRAVSTPVAPPAASLPTPAQPDDPTEAAREALAAGDYRRATKLTVGRTDPSASAIRIRAIANADGSDAAREVAAEAIERHPLVPELHFLHAVLLVDTGYDVEAERAARRAVYLDRSLALAHFLLGGIRARRGDTEGARRFYQAAVELCARLPPATPVAFGDGERAGRLAEAAAIQVQILTEALP